jgi:hypothetical protein
MLSKYGVNSFASELGHWWVLMNWVVKFVLHKVLQSGLNIYPLDVISYLII